MPGKHNRKKTTMGSSRKPMGRGTFQKGQDKYRMPSQRIVPGGSGNAKKVGHQRMKPKRKRRAPSGQAWSFNRARGG